MITIINHDAGDATKAPAITAPRSSLADALPSLGGGRSFTLTLWLIAAAMIVLAARSAETLLHFPPHAHMAGFEDLPVFHHIGAFANAGRLADAYDPEIFHAALGPDHQKLAWMNPPHASLLFSPLGAAPYGVVKAAWIALSMMAMAGIAFMTGAHVRNRSIVAIASPAFFSVIIIVQFGAFAAAALLFALRYAKTRPILAGAMLALLTIKPQYGLLAPIFLIASGSWRAFFAAAAFSLCFIGLSLIVHGIEPWRAFFNSMGTVHVAHAMEMRRGMIDIHQGLIKLGAGPGAQIAGYAAAIAASIALTWRLTRRADPDIAIAAVMILSVLIAPSAWIYDWPFVAAGALLLAGKADWKTPLADGVLSTAWIAPVAPLFFYGIPASLIPTLSIVAIAGLIAIKAVVQPNAFSQGPRHNKAAGV